MRNNNEFVALIRPSDLNQTLEKQMQSTEAPPHNLQHLQDPLLAGRCQIPQHTSKRSGADHDSNRQGHGMISFLGVVATCSSAH